MIAYQRADDRFDRARSPRDLGQVSASLAEARFEMATAKALLTETGARAAAAVLLRPSSRPVGQGRRVGAAFGGWSGAGVRDAARIAAGEQRCARSGR